AVEVLANEGYIVLPYVSPDVCLVKKLENAGAAAIMPLAAPIGSNQGLRCKDLIEMILEYSKLPVIVDAGLGKPSHAAQAMEMGADAVLVNTAIATAADPVTMGRAFSLAVEAGQTAFLAKMAAVQRTASASSPLTGFLQEGVK
ncbi:MAG: thiazole synthase, partial [Spirochaetes bacterium]|nr:thiazole synthase [Spirochaetota bacterium]